ncbi:MAG: hypothetical protein GY782_02490 [Gammaproteobacteria bacterium]|nr:hypothetical protein [Gammaproteobacteria bacterium]
MKRFKQFKIYCKDKDAIDDCVRHMLWIGWKAQETNINYNYKFLLFDDNSLIRTEKLHKVFEQAKDHIEITHEELNFLKYNDIVTEKREFDIKPFDRVLVRDYRCKIWLPGLFWSLREEEQQKDFPFRNIGGCMYGCIAKYEGNEDKLGTTEDIENSWSKEDIL